MNILPKKRWHVRTKENIARVRKDEAKAAQEKQEQEERAKLAETEARLSLLRAKARERVQSSDYISLSSAPEDATNHHVNFFTDLENGTAELKQINKEHEKEKKEEKEKYEKKIGYLTYLGQDTNEALGKKNWYDVAPKRFTNEKEEVHMKSKILNDPLNNMKKHLSLPGIEEQEIVVPHNTSLCKKHKRKRRRSLSSEDLKSKSHKKHKKKHKHKKSKKNNKQSDDEYYSDSEQERLKRIKKLELLRIERLFRERDERMKSQALLAKLKGEKLPEPKPAKPLVKQKYNSQFNPDLAKQNYTF
ncbi:hypothetical protein FQA39_LY11359 [Lamprigera yunnana]|nr:hypothetical protein FQA39_LY11359 [Lamprigera yunnana]